MNFDFMKNAGLLLTVGIALSANASPLPFVETFEAADGVMSGALHGQNGWITTGGTADVQSTTVQSGSQALEIQNAQVAHNLSNSNSAMWLHFQVRCEKAPTVNSTVTAPNTSLAFFVNTNLNIVVYSNTVPVELSARIQTNTWTRFDVYCDYADLHWDLGMNGVNIAAGLPLYSTNSPIGSMVVGNESPSPVYFDQIDIADTEQTASGLPDTDADSIPDWWEQKNFGGVTNVVAGNPSGNNGLTYLETYIAGVSPFVNDPFKVSPISGGNGLQWTPVQSRLYSVYWTTNLLAGFTMLQENIPYPQSEFVDEQNTGETAGFYRLSVKVE